MKKIFITIVSLSILSLFGFAFAEVRVDEPRVIISPEERRERARETAKEVLDRVGDVDREEKEDVLIERANEVLSERLRNRTIVLSENMNRLNENLSKRYMGLISGIGIVLDKLENRVYQIEMETNENLEETYLQIEELRSYLKEVLERVSEQRNKYYLLELSSQETLGLEFREVLSNVREDHKVLLEEAINPLRFSIREIINDLKHIINND